MVYVVFLNYLKKMNYLNSFYNSTINITYVFFLLNNFIIYFKLSSSLIITYIVDKNIKQVD